MSYEEVVALFKSDKFNNDVWLKLDYILSQTGDWTDTELMSIYDNLENINI